MSELERSEENQQVEQPTIQETPNTWYSDEYKEVVENKGFKDANDVLKSYANLEKVSSNSIRIPSAEAGKEDLEAFYSKLDNIPGIIRQPNFDDQTAMNQFYDSLGRPESADKYQYELGQEHYDSIPGLQNHIDNFSGIAHQLGLSNDQAKALVNMKLHEQIQLDEQALKSVESAENFLKKQWGNDYSNRNDAAQQMAKVYAEKYPQEMQAFAQSDAARNPMTMILLSELAKNYQEQGHVGMTKTNFGLSPEEAILRATEIRNNKSHPYNNPTDPGHQAAKAKMKELYAAAYPSE